ncbi:RNA-directed DNA polymerase, eukaryota [Tanacetum coccineum]
MAARARSNVDHTRLISKSIFVTNFPDNTTSKDLWEVCKGYGTVVDVFIPDRKSKAGKRFAFVRFIKVDNVDRLVGLVLDAMVLDDECVVERDLDNFVMGEVKDFSSINNLRVLLSNEGFQHVRLAYFGGLWVMIKLTLSNPKMRFMKPVGVASWFIFDEKADSMGHEHTQNLSPQREGEILLEIHFNRLKIPFPPGFIISPEREFQHVDAQEGQVLWGNYKFEYTISEAVGNSGGILCVWDLSVFRKEHHVVSNNFVALYGFMVLIGGKFLVVSIYAPQSITSKRSLWSYIRPLQPLGRTFVWSLGDF